MKCVSLTPILGCLVSLFILEGCTSGESSTAPQSTDSNDDTAWNDTDTTDTGSSEIDDPFIPRYVFNEEFDSPVLPMGWITIDANDSINEEGYYGWTPTSGSSWCTFCAPHCVITNAQGAQADDWLISPPIALGDEPLLLWSQEKSIMPSMGVIYEYEIRISTDKPIPEDFEHHPPVFASNISGQGGLYHRNLDLSAYANETVYLALRNISLDAADICVNYFRVVDGIEYPGQWSGPTGTEVTTSDDPVPLYDFESVAPWYECPVTGIPKGTTVVTAINDYQDANRQTVSNLVTFPAGHNWKQVGLRLDVSCPENGRCDNGDNTFSSFTQDWGHSHISLILNPSAHPDDYNRLELLRYAPAMGRGMCAYVDLTPHAHLLTGDLAVESYIQTNATWLADQGDGWQVTAQFVFNPTDDLGSSTTVTSETVTSRQRIVLGDTTPGADIASQFGTPSFQVPASTGQVIAHLVTSGHNGGYATRGCGYNGNDDTWGCALVVYLSVNGTVFPVELTHEGVDYCYSSPARPQFGGFSSDELNGWCYGAATMGHKIDITGAVNLTGTNNLALDILLWTGEVYENLNVTPEGREPHALTTLTLHYLP